MKLPEWNWLKSTSQKQLELELAPLEEFLDQYIKNPPVPANLSVAQKALLYVNKSRAEVREARTQNAWALYYDAELVTYQLMDPAEVDAKAGKLLFEDTAMLSDGAKQNIRRLIGQDSGSGGWKLVSPIKLENVIECRRIVQNYYNNKYIYLELTMQQLAILTVIALALSVASIITLTLVPSTGAVPTGNWLFWFTIGLLGGSGGAISGLLGLKDAFALKSDTPERLLNKWMTIAKPIIGFAAAIIIAIFAIAGLVQVADLTVSIYLIFALAFVSGFSERLIIGAVASRLP